MKRLLVLLFIIFNSSFLKAGELDGVVIFSPTPYEQKSSLSESIKSSALIGAGDLINYDIIKEVKKQVESRKKDLSDYFPGNAEFDTFVNNVATEGKRSIFPDNNLTDAKMIKYYEYIGTKLIGGFADKILNAEGIKDLARRELWVKKMLAPFSTCISKSRNSQYEASHCIDSLKDAILPNMGLALVYELSREKLESVLPEANRERFKIDQMNSYKACVTKSKTISTPDVKKCAVDAMKGGVLTVANLKLTQTIDEKASSPAAAKTIRQNLWPAYSTCTNSIDPNKESKIALSTQFMNCIDDLIQNAGMLMVQDKVSNNSTIVESFKKPEVTKLSDEKMQSFKACILDQKKNNKRIEGMLDTDRCENEVTNDVVYKVVVKSLELTAAKSFKDKPSLALSIGKEGHALLDKCWNPKSAPKDREECLRKTIMAFAPVMATAELNLAIPDDTKNKKEMTISTLKNSKCEYKEVSGKFSVQTEACAKILAYIDTVIPDSTRSKDEIIKASLVDLSKCLNQELPTSISDDNNLTAQTDTCAGQLAKRVAMEVAAATIRSKGLEQKFEAKEIYSLVANEVDIKFEKCLGDRPSDAALKKCPADLTKSVAVKMATTQFKTSAAGKLTAEESDLLVKDLVNQKFASCIGKDTSDANLNNCIATLTKNATKAVVLSYSKKQIKEQLNADKTPTLLKPVEEAFAACIDKPYPAAQTSKSVDECTKQFALGFARVLGEMKVNSTLISVLGTDGFHEQKKTIDEILGKYNSCLDHLKKVNMEDGLLDKLTICTDNLQARATNFVSSVVDKWMSTEQKDAATLLVKNAFANFIPCLSGFLPAAPFSEELSKNVDSILKVASFYLAQFIDYDPENAKKSLENINEKLSTTPTADARKELIDLMYKDGTLDQFLKSMVRGEVKKALEQTSENDLPKEIRDLILQKGNFDKIFATNEGKAIKDMVMEKLLKPVLMNDADMKSPEMTAGMAAVKDRVIKMLLNAPSFGDQIIKMSVQNEINKEFSGFLGSVEKFGVKKYFGEDSINWEKTRTTKNGQIAENYIKDNILLPAFTGKTISPEEAAVIKAEATKLVKAAVTSK